MDATAATTWLLDSDEPAVAYLARRDVLGEPVPHPDAAIMRGAKVRALLADQRPDGGFGVHPYRKWTGAHWRLVSLVELAVPAGEPRAVAAAEGVLDWLTGGPARAAGPLPRSHASIQGNALAVGVRLGLAGDHRVRRLADDLRAWQWPDGGWNCDPAASGRRSSFHESLVPMWGLHEYAVATGDSGAADAADRTAELLLEHRVYRSLRTGEPVHPSWTRLRYPRYWHYDLLHALLVLSRMGRVRDPRAADALDLLEARRKPDGCWRTSGSWWSPPGAGRPAPEAVDWGRGPSEMLTLDALRVLRSAGRLD